MRRCGINFTLLGESIGNADVEYERHRDAVYAIIHLKILILMEESLILDFLIWKKLIMLEIDWDLGIEI